MFGTGKSFICSKMQLPTNNRENGRKRLIEEQKAKRENEQTQRAAMYVSLIYIYDRRLTFSDHCRVSLRTPHHYVYVECPLHMLAKLTDPKTPEHEQEELDQYHQKVYRASRQMAESHAGELKRLGVPFFGARPDLLLPDSDESLSPLNDEEAIADEGIDGKITQKQLLALQRKMVNHLAELYGD
jgi:hypothetical protein